MRRTVVSTLTAVVAMVVSPAFAQDAAPAPEGILPLADYSGDLGSRRYLSGDWGGTRSDLAGKGFSADVDWTQVGQGVVKGGRNIDWDYGGSVDLVLNADLQRMGLLPGALLKLRGESRYGETVNDDSGSVLPVNTDGFFPLAGSTNEGIWMTITELTYVQYLSSSFGVFAGKLQTLDGDPNEFAGGRGRSQFMNSSFVFNPAGALVVPYSTLGGGAIWVPCENVLVSSSLFTTADSSTTSGFENVGDGWTWSTEAQFQYKLGSLPGGQNVGAAYAFAGDFREIGGKLSLIPGQGVQLPDASDSWFVYWSGWQYLFSPEQPAARINTTDGRADLQGIGLFARLGLTDQDTNPVEWTASVGVGGRGLIPSRESDTYGVGFAYTSLQSTRAFSVLNIEDSTQAIELYYNVVVTPSIDLTFDAQWVDGASQNVAEATVLGARVNVRF